MYEFKKWRFTNPCPDDFIKEFSDYSPIILQLLYNRGITTKDQIDAFFNSNYELDVHDPFLLSDINKAVWRIFQAVLKKEKIAVYGDYDTDGVVATVLLVEALESILKTKINFYIPDRKKEGYGLHNGAIKHLASEDIKLIITVDCGVSNDKEIRFAKKLGIDIIVTDHHHIENFPECAFCVINPKRKNEKYPFKELTGVGVAFKLTQALLSYNQNKNIINTETDSGFEKWLLDLVAIGTIADCAPLIGENRTLVKCGLIVLNKTKREGLRAIIKSAGIENRKLDTFSIGFQIAPRINVAGRLRHAKMAYQLLTTRSKEEAKIIVRKLESTNRLRQKLTDRIILEAKQQVGVVSNQNKVLLAAKENWPAGLLGIVAGRLTNEFGRPALVIEKGPSESVGSARSIPSFNIIKAISRCSNLLLQYGGHREAAGFTLKNENIPLFYKQLRTLAEEQLEEEDLLPGIEIDAEINLSDINWRLLEQIELFEPTGTGNQKPVFVARKTRINDLWFCGTKGKHLKLRVIGDQNSDIFEANRIFDIIGFNFGDYGKILKKGDLIDVAFQIYRDEWEGFKKLQLKLIDFNLSGKDNGHT